VYWIGPIAGSVLAGILNETWLNPHVAAPPLNQKPEQDDEKKNTEVSV
jgi:hypothetical protein